MNAAAEAKPPHAPATRGALAAYCCVTTLFFAWGFITSLVDPLVAAVKGIFELSDLEAQLSASAFFVAYGVMSFPAAAMIARWRPANMIVMALALMLTGCMTMLLAANVAAYGLVLLGLFILASGITILQVAANPLASVLGRPELSHFRLTLSQALNSLGTFIGPYLGAVLFLHELEVRPDLAVSNAARSGALAGIDTAFFWIGGFLLALILFFLAVRPIIDRATRSQAAPAQFGMFALLSEALRSRWAVFGGVAIFCYVGAEVAIGTQLAFFLNDRTVLDLSLQDAAKLVSLYWGGAMVGRIIGSALLARVPAAALLTVFAITACTICLYIASVGGPSAGYIALCIGLMNSIMFPVIFTLTLERSGVSSEATSGLLCFSIIGGAVMPPLAGLVSGAAGYGMAFLVPATGYAAVTLFALVAARTRPIGIAGGPVIAGH